MTSIDHAAYWTTRDTAMDTEIATDAAYAASDAGQLHAAQRRLNLVTGQYASFTDADRAAALEAIATIEQRMQNTADAEWTRETTSARRAAWNAAVRNPSYRTRDGKSVLVGKIVSDLGFTVEELKAAIARHGL